jgi:hypothetical protein
VDTALGPLLSIVYKGPFFGISPLSVPINEVMSQSIQVFSANIKAIRKSLARKYTISLPIIDRTK